MTDSAVMLLHFSPELVLAIGALVVLSYDLAIRGKDGRQAWITGVTLVASLGLSLLLFTYSSQELFGVAAGAGSPGRPGAFLSDPFTQFFRVVGALAGLLILFSGSSFMAKRTPFRGEFYTLLLFAIVAMNLMAGANDLVTVAVAVEFLSITSYLLTGWLRGDHNSSEGALKYFLYGSMASAAMLYGFAFMYGASGSTSIPLIGAVVSDPTELYVVQIGNLMLPALMLVLVGVGFKIAVAPFHQWSPDAYQGAPTPVTSFLSIGPKVAGFALLARFLLAIFGTPHLAAQWIGLLGAMAILSMLIGNLVGLVQTNVKRMMAYSSIAQAGYMMIGIVGMGAAAAAARPEALGSVLIYVLAYLFTNAGVFAAVIAVEHATGSSDLEAFDGLMHRAPLVAVAMFLFFLSLVGIPPMAGFIGKFAVFKTALASGQGMLAVVGVLAGVISVGYYFNVVRRMFFMPKPDGAAAIVPSSGLAFVIVACLVMTLVIGLYAGPFVELANEAASAIVPLGATAAEAVARP